MASFSQKIECKYGTSTYQDVKDTYDWIVKSAEKLKLSKLRVSEQFVFKSGEITFHADNISELGTYAYGSTDFDLNSFFVTIYDGDTAIAWVGYCIFLAVHSDDKAILEKFVGLLHDTTLDEMESINSIPVYISQNNKGMIINGNGNIFTNNSNKVKVSNGTADSKSGIRQWTEAILQSLLANGIWCLLGALVVALIAYIAEKG
jgi:hypothetical protein